jgi:outer membrane protein OmpA-like peptidoglycan-associated protein
MAAMAAPSAPSVQQPAAPPPVTSPRGNQQVAVIQFGAGSAGLTSNDFAILQRVAEIQRNNRATVRIVAHAQQDAAGSSADQAARANYEVSRQRALAVANQLVRLGVPANRIVAEAASDAVPAFETTSARGIAANRRAEIFVDF